MVTVLYIHKLSVLPFYYSRYCHSRLMNTNCNNYTSFERVSIDYYRLRHILILEGISNGSLFQVPYFIYAPYT